MFARVLEHVIARVVTPTAVVVGLACNLTTYDGVELHDAVVRGVNVVPMPAPGDTAAKAAISLRFESPNIAPVLTYEYFVWVAPAGTIDSIALYDVAPGEPLPAAATAILCASSTACAGTRGPWTVTPPATVATIRATIRTSGLQVVFFTTTAQKAAGGAMRGTVYPDYY